MMFGISLAVGGHLGVRGVVRAPGGLQGLPHGLAVSCCAVLAAPQLELDGVVLRPEIREQLVDLRAAESKEQERPVGLIAQGEIE